MNWLNFRFGAFLIILAVVILAGIIGFSAFEKFSLFDSFYLTMITISTVGYGDIYPVTDAGKMLAIFIIAGGVSSFVGLLETTGEIVISRRERLEKMEKLNMLIGAFFSEMGTDLLARFSASDPGLDKMRENLIVRADWTDKEFSEVSMRIRKHDYDVNIKKIDLNALRNVITGKRWFMLQMIQNQNLMEHETFTDLLEAVFHLTEELSHRKKLKNLTERDCAHIEDDVRRVYRLLAVEWLNYMKYLKNNYDYFFSFAMRTNPFDRKAKAKLGSS